MGTAHIVVHSDLRLRICTDPALTDLIEVVTESLFDDDGLWIMKVKSPLLAAGYNYEQDLIVEGSTIKFKPTRDV